MSLKNHSEEDSILYNEYGEEISSVDYMDDNEPVYNQYGEDQGIAADFKGKYIGG